MTSNSSNSRFNTDQIRNARLESGGIKKKATDGPRFVQARKLWKKRWGRELGFTKFEQYLGTIPEIPPSLLADNPELPLLVLVDSRLRHVESCRMAGLDYARSAWDDSMNSVELVRLKYEQYGFNDDTLVPVDDRHTIAWDKPYWVRAHDGSPNLGRKPSDCLAECTDKLLAGTADVGIAIWIQHGPCKHVMDLPGSVHVSDRESCACIHPFGRAGLVPMRFDGASQKFGAVVFIRG